MVVVGIVDARDIVHEGVRRGLQRARTSVESRRKRARIGISFLGRLVAFVRLRG